MTWDTVQQLVLILLQIGAGWLINQGWITADHVTALVGAGTSILGIAWWAFWESGRGGAPEGGSGA